MKIKQFFFLFFCFKLLFAQDANIQTSIGYEIQENLINLNSSVLNKDEIIYDLNYLFLVIKQSEKGNLSNQKQEGKFIVKSNEKVALGNVNINFDKNDKLKAYLFIRDEQENKLIKKDSINLILDENFLTNNKVDRLTNDTETKSNSFVVRGLVSDHTKTKIGKDFFDIFYSEYNLMNQKFPFLIEIYEYPPQGRNSRVNVIVEDKVVTEFMLRPDEEYLKEVSAYLFRSLFAFDKNRKIVNTY